MAVHGRPCRQLRTSGHQMDVVVVYIAAGDGGGDCAIDAGE